MSASTLPKRAQGSRVGSVAGGESGLTLAEVLVAMVVFTVGALGLGAVIPMGMNRVTDSASDTRASALAANRCENILETPYDDPDLDPGTHVDPANPYEGLYNIEWTVEENQPLDACKRVTVVVRHSSRNNTMGRLVVVVPRSGT